MKIFLSWSGEQAHLVAKALYEFLQDINQSFEVWMSETEIKAGMRWAYELAKGLEDTNFGIICITAESIDSHWLLCEAGAISKSVLNSRVCPYLIDIVQDELEGPLSQFQSKNTSKDSTWELILAINEIAEDAKLEESRLRRYFEQNWPDFNSKITCAKETILSEQVALQIGKRVLALWPDDDYWYSGTINDIKGKRLFVYYDDGYKKWLTAEKIISLDYKVGDPVECRWKGADYYYPAYIVDTEEDNITVQYDSNSSPDGPSLAEKEQTSIGLLRFMK
jgi:hypothetical protein